MLRFITRAGLMAAVGVLTVSCFSSLTQEADGGVPIKWPGLSGDESYAVGTASSLRSWMSRNEGDWDEEAADSILFVDGKGDSPKNPANILIEASDTETAEKVAEAFSQWEHHADQDNYVHVYSKEDKELKASVAN